MHTVSIVVVYVRRLVRLVTHDAEPLLGLLQSFYSTLHRHRNDVQQRQVRYGRRTCTKCMCIPCNARGRWRVLR